MKKIALYEDCDEDGVMQVAKRFVGILSCGDVISLKGDLGAGKTFFAKALLKMLGYKGEVPSPTFPLVQVYEELTPPVWHFDLYRLKTEEEVYELGIEEAFLNAVSLIEWAEKASHVLPKDLLEINITFTDNDNTRHITLTGNEKWQTRLKSF